MFGKGYMFRVPAKVLWLDDYSKQVWSRTKLPKNLTLLKMPYFSRRLAVSLRPLVNLDLFKKGFYHISVQLIDQKAEENLARVTCVEVKDLYGPQQTDFSYPGACCVNGAHFITQTSLIEYSEQSVLLGECFMFQSDCPIKSDHTDAYIPSHFKLQLDLMFTGEEELPSNPSLFSSVSMRTLEFCVDWRKGMHDHFPVMFDYFHMAAVGVTLHASLTELSLKDFFPEVNRPNSSGRRHSAQNAKPGRKLTFQSQPSIQCLPSLHSILFGSQSTLDVPINPPHAVRSLSLPMDARNGDGMLNGKGLQNGGKGADTKVVCQTTVEQQIERAQDAHHMLCDVLRSARNTLHTCHASMSKKDVGKGTPDLELAPVTAATSLLEAEELCIKLISQLNANLSASWEWFCSSIMRPEMTGCLATRTHGLRMKYASESLVSVEHPYITDRASIGEPTAQMLVAHQIRKSLVVPMALFCKENVDTGQNSSIIFIEPSPWPTLEEGQLPVPAASSDTGETTGLKVLPGTAPGLQGFSHHLNPYLMDMLPQASSSDPDGGRRKSVHLVVCVHGLQGNQYDLRLYRILLSLALPHAKLEFLMASSNQSDTFCDFNLMTDRLLEEVLDHVRGMATSPSKVSFLGHSLGSIIVRSLITRPEFASLHPKLHLFFSICGPHLGTKYQNGMVSFGMWAVRKWHNSRSLLQLSLKDAPNPMDSFLYHLSEAPSLECFRHVVLMTSPQDKYVPYHSAKIASAGKDGSFQSDLSLHMMHNILEPLRKARVNLVRLSVDHSIPASANSFIGRAAHIAMLDNELFIQKLVNLHLVQYFIET